MFFTNEGRVYSLKAYEIPEERRQAKGTAIINLLNLNGNEKISAVIPLKEYDPESILVFITKNGIVKKTKLEYFKNIRKTGIIAITLRENDELISVRKTHGSKELIVATVKGKSIRFSEKDVREMGRTAAGVKAISLDDDDNVIAMDLIEDGKDLLVISEKGYGKRTPLDEYRLQNRGGKGIITYQIKDKTGPLVSAKVVDAIDEIMLISLKGVIIRLNVEGISEMGRSTQGVTLMKIEDDDKVVAVAKYVEEVEE